MSTEQEPLRDERREAAIARVAKVATGWVDALYGGVPGGRPETDAGILLAVADIFDRADDARDEFVGNTADRSIQADLRRIAAALDAERATRQVAAPEPLREGVRKAITDAYYDARNAGETMETAADNATAAALRAAAQGPEQARCKGVCEYSDEPHYHGPEQARDTDPPCPNCEITHPWRDHGPLDEQARDSGGLRERIVTALEREPTLTEVREYGMDGGEGSTFNTLQWRLDLIREALSQGAAHEEPDLEVVMQGFRNRHPKDANLFGPAHEERGLDREREEDAEVRMAAASLVAALHDDIAMCGGSSQKAYERLAALIHGQGAAAGERIRQALAATPAPSTEETGAELRHRNTRR